MLIMSSHTFTVPRCLSGVLLGDLYFYCLVKFNNRLVAYSSITAMHRSMFFSRLCYPMQSSQSPAGEWHLPQPHLPAIRTSTKFFSRTLCHHPSSVRSQTADIDLAAGRSSFQFITVPKLLSSYQPQIISFKLL